MKKYFILFIIVACNISFAGNDNTIIKKIVAGKVIDKSSGEEIAGAEIKINNETIYTDLNGSFTTSIDITKTKAVVKYISYNDANIILDPLSYNTITIELTSK